MDSSGVPDEELTRGAQSGDVAALGALLARHQAGMRAVALSLLGPGPDADDALQDAALVALRRVGTVRDPSAVGPWLRMIVRNACRTRLRSAGDVLPVDLDELVMPSPDRTPEEALDRHVMRDWVWRAIEELSPPLRTAVVLRHFSTRVSSYDRIAAVCGVPVGTVRSRLSQARAKLAEALTATAGSAFDDTAARTAASRRDALETLAAAERGRFGSVLADRWSPDVTFFGGQRPLGGRDLLLRGMECDLEAGVRQRVAHVITSRSLTIWEMDLVNPAHAPEHCPPAVAWVMSHDDGLVSGLRLHHSPAS